MGIPCYTIRLETSQWQNFRQGITDIQHYTGTATVAVRRDGSFRAAGDRQESYLFVAGWKSEYVSMSLAPEDRVVRVFPQAHEYSSRAPVIWHDRPFRRSKDGDATCATGILHFGTDFRRAGSTTIAGVPVVHWTRRNGMNGEDNFYLAPSLDCNALRIRMVHRTRWYVPTYVYSVEAVSVELGEPKPELFRIPDGYRLIHNPGLGRH